MFNLALDTDTNDMKTSTMHILCNLINILIIRARLWQVPHSSHLICMSCCPSVTFCSKFCDVMACRRPSLRFMKLWVDSPHVRNGGPHLFRIPKVKGQGHRRPKYAMLILDDKSKKHWSPHKPGIDPIDSGFVWTFETFQSL